MKDKLVCKFINCSSTTFAIIFEKKVKPIFLIKKILS